MTVVIRTATIADLPQLESHVPETRPGRHAQDLADQARGLRTYAVAWLSERPVGHGLIHWSGPRHPNGAELLGPIPEIYRLEVQPKFQSIGIGTRLVAFLESIVRDRGFDTTCLFVVRANVRARQLYLRLQYSPANVPSFIDQRTWIDPSGRTHEEFEECEWFIKTLPTQDQLGRITPRNLDAINQHLLADHAQTAR